MKKLMILPLVFLLCFMVGCQDKEVEIERIMENGVEVIINHLEPYKIGGEPTTLHLAEEFTINSGDDNVAETGLTDILHFDVDSEGYIYFLKRRADKNAVFKFDPEGNFIKSFVRRGQGPGEIVNQEYFAVGPGDDIAVPDSFRKLFIYDKEGNFKREVDLQSNDMFAMPLENGNYLIQKRVFEPDSDYDERPLILCGPGLEEIKELGKYRRANIRIQGKWGYPRHRFEYYVSDGKIYVGNSESGYEIRIYDLDGNLIRKIRKEYTPVEVSEEFREETLKSFEDPSRAFLREKIYVRKHYPAFQYFFTDDEEHLFVMTHEEGQHSGEYLYDIFNDAGVFVSRISLDKTAYEATAKNRRLYYLRERENEYKELVVNKMTWE